MSHVWAMSLGLLLVTTLICVAYSGTPAEQGIEHGTCRWICGKKGVYVMCNSDEIVAGYCGSGGDTHCTDKNRCPGQSYITHAIKCCTYTTTPDV